MPISISDTITAPLLQSVLRTTPTIAARNEFGVFGELLNPGLWIGFFVILFTVIVFLILLRLLFQRFAGGVREASLEKKSLGATIFEVRVPRNNEVEIQAADQMFSGLLGISENYKGFKKLTKARSFVSFEIVGLPESIRFYVVASRNLANTVEKAINGAYPTAEIVTTDEYNIFAENSKVKFAALKLDKDSYKPIRTYEELTTDSIASLLTTMSKLRMGESAALQVVVTGAGSLGEIPERSSSIR
ncbi:MAG: hypothetical protein UZ20_WS6002000272 [candidate division WS6 bacterium OLB21]|uniref:DUF8128 domain-containing protein n=1 Tax=candidate division WS6 bacterium OLB21 TaxID=1617427 RepID=A0A136KJX1_9BACT|nr:MAG: hypothetical protein UZ20_WS6002000272 [candidate division WS6 bacterium OLB21]